MTVTNFSKAKKIPTKVTTRKSNPTTTNFAKGIYTYKPNDLMDYDEVYLAQNARFDRIGEYKTRLGLQEWTKPANLVTTGNLGNNLDSIDLTKDTRITISGNDKWLYSFTVKLQSLSQNEDTILKAVIYNASTDEVLGASCSKIPYDTITKNITFTFKDGVVLDTPGNYYVKFYPQSNKDKYKIGVESGTQNIMINIDSTDVHGEIIGIYEANITNVGATSKYVLFAFKQTSGTTKLYRAPVNPINFMPTYVTEMRTLPNGVEKVRFYQCGNKIRYVDGKEGPRIINPSNNWSDSAITTVDLKTDTDLAIKTSNILPGTEDNIMYFDADTTTQVVWTYPYGFMYNNSAINSYDKFDRDFRQNFPAIDTGDPITAMFNLGGIIYILTRRNKYYMYSQTADVWTQQASSAQHGTFSQESCVWDTNYAYYANDDGIYVFDGSSEASITQNTIQSTYDAIKTTYKEKIILELYNNRLYVFYKNGTSSSDNRCLVYNTNLKLWESFDTGLPISATTARETATNRFYCGSNRFCQIFMFESVPNSLRTLDRWDYSDLGAPIDFDLMTSYLHFGTPSQLHRITKWRPEFSRVDGDYAIKCGYALDFTNDVKYAFSIDLKNNIPIDEHYVWDNPPDYGNAVSPTKLTTIPQINGQFYRCQIRYQHHAAFEPVNFKSHTLSCETQRLR